MSEPPIIRRLKGGERKALALLAAATFAAILAACFFKYAIFEYDGMDLAIFNQIFWNTVRGRPFAQSIHPHLSLGDHAEFAVLLLAPIYALVQDPRTLLVLQAGAVLAPAFAVLALARARLAAAGRHAVTAAVPLALAAAWLLNPSVLNIALFEFHILPFALLPLMLTLVAYVRGKKRAFIVFAVLAMLVREDVAMVVAAIGILAWMERRAWWWRLAPAALGIAWFAAAMRVIASFAPASSYKYAVYYRWLGETPLDMLANAAADPVRVLAHVLTIPNLEMVIGLAMPLAFLPLVRPKALVLAVGPLLQILLGAPGGGEIILETHYATLLLPAVFLAAIDGADHVLRHPPKLPSYAGPGDWPKLVYLVLAIAAVFSWLSLGPFPGVIEKALRPGDAWARDGAARQALSRIPADAPVAASYRLLPALSSRERVFSAHYIFLGVTQFAEGEYPVPDDLRFSVIDVDDLATYRAQFLPTLWTAPYFPGGHDRLIAAIGGPILHRTPFSVHQVGAPWPSAPPPPIGPIAECGPVALTGAAAYSGTDPIDGPLLAVSASVERLAPDEKIFVRTIVTDRKGRDVFDVTVPLDVLPPHVHLSANGVVVSSVFPLAGLPSGAYRPSVRIVREDAAYLLDDLRSPYRKVRRSEILCSSELSAVAVE